METKESSTPPVQLVPLVDGSAMPVFISRKVQLGRAARVRHLRRSSSIVVVRSSCTLPLHCGAPHALLDVLPVGCFLFGLLALADYSPHLLLQRAARLLRL